jgi:hypothetical protein
VTQAMDVYSELDRIVAVYCERHQERVVDFAEVVRVAIVATYAVLGIAGDNSVDPRSTIRYWADNSERPTLHRLSRIIDDVIVFDGLKRKAFASVVPAGCYSDDELADGLVSGHLQVRKRSS